MTSIDIKLDGDGCWPEFAPLRAAGKLVAGQITGAALLPDGEVLTPSGESRRLPIVTLRIQAGEQTVAVLVKLDTLDMIVRAFHGRLEYLAAQHAAGRGDA